jgi:hypothetical protein
MYLRNFSITNLLLCLFLLFPMTASAHIISIAATSPFPAQMNVSSAATATYTVTNIASKIPFTVVDQSQLPSGVSIINSTCGELMYPGQHCLITLQLTASSSPNTLTGVIKEWASPSLDGVQLPIIVKIVPIVAYNIGGTITGLTGTVVLQNNGTNSTSISTDGNFIFANPAASGSSYSVTIQTQPANQTCSITNGIGIVGQTNVSNIGIVCSTNSYTVGGTVAGLSGTVTLQNNGVNLTPVSTNGAFTFSIPVAQGSPYNVTVTNQPATQTCTVGNGTGIMGAGNVTNVNVTCAVNTYTVGGTVSGLTGTVVLQNNATNTTSISANGSYTFSTPIAQGALYNVSVLTQPSGQNCTLTNNSGTVGSSNITNVGVTCLTMLPTTISAGTGTIPVSSGGTATNSLIVTNVGANTAYNVVAILPSGWTGVTQNATNCATIAPSGTCSLIFSSTQPYVAQSGIAIQGTNTNTVSIKMATTMTPAGSTEAYLVWAVSGSTAQVVDNMDAAVGVVWGQQTVRTFATSDTNGASNTTLIVQQDPSTTSASYCYNSTNGNAMVGTWYLPAICQLGPPSQGICSTGGLANIYSNLYQLSLGGFANNRAYWSSTEYAPNPVVAAVVEYFGGTNQYFQNKANLSSVRCARSISF